MPNIYASWSVDKLNKEIGKIQRIIEKKESRNKKEALAKLTQVARSSGFELHELIGEKPAKEAKVPTVATRKPATKKSKKRGKVAPKYRNPENQSETWTGRGRQPIWVRQLVENGGSLVDVTIS